ncbi:MAG: hypothetical protein HC918_12550 [Oscillatoriales cyanobacterium SM2_1_8]|nr:hypothetical protein [Oscillatoriales cyanobacterium SM2_1_8]
MLVPDRDRPCPVDRLSDRFRLRPGPFQAVPSRMRGILVEALAPIPPNLVLTAVDVTAEVLSLAPELEPQWEALAAAIVAGNKPSAPLGPHCKNCEFPDGFRECWGELATVKPHVFDFGGQPIALAETVAQGKARAGIFRSKPSTNGNCCNAKAGKPVKNGDRPTGATVAKMPLPFALY